MKTNQKMRAYEFSGDSLAEVKTKIVAAKPGQTRRDKAATQAAADSAAYKASMKPVGGADY